MLWHEAGVLSTSVSGVGTRKGATGMGTSVLSKENRCMEWGICVWRGGQGNNVLTAGTSAQLTQTVVRVIVEVRGKRGKEM